MKPRYVALLAGTFEASGLTVHEILGKSIATADRLADLPRPFQLATFPLASSLTASDVADLARKGKALETASIKAGAAARFWTGVQNTAMNRFDAEEILELAKTQAQALERLDEQTRALQRLGLAGIQLPDLLPALIDIFEAAREVADPSQVVLLPSLATKTASRALEAFIDDCRAHSATRTIWRD